MSKQPDMSWGAIGGIWLAAMLIFGFLWLVGYFDSDDDKSPSEPTVMVSDGLGLMCMTKLGVQQTQEAIERRDQEKFTYMFKQNGCWHMDPNVRVKHISGVSVIKVEYEGRVGWTLPSEITYVPVSEVQQPLQ